MVAYSFYDIPRAIGVVVMIIDGMMPYPRQASFLQT